MAHLLNFCSMRTSIAIAALDENCDNTYLCYTFMYDTGRAGLGAVPHVSGSGSRRQPVGRSAKARPDAADRRASYRCARGFPLTFAVYPLAAGAESDDRRG